MDEKLFAALLSAGLAALGWAASSAWDRYRERERVAREARSKYLERQIEELYGPLFKITMQIVTTNHVRFGVVKSVPAEKRGEIDQMFYREHFRPLHDSARELLKAKLHLVESSALPRSFYDYLRHSIQERVQQDLWQQHQIDTNSVEGVRFPDSFTEDVQRSLSNLLAEYDEVLVGLHRSRGAHSRKSGVQ